MRTHRKTCTASVIKEDGSHRRSLTGKPGMLPWRQNSELARMTQLLFFMERKKKVIFNSKADIPLLSHSDADE